MKEELEQIKQTALAKIASIKDIKSLKDFEIKVFGRKGDLNNILKKLKGLSKEEKPVIGKLANQIKQELIQAMEGLKASLSQQDTPQLTVLDMTWPDTGTKQGHQHPLTQFSRKVEDIFISMGFEVIEGQEVETPKYNFDLLNIPKDHPARDLWDTYYLEQNLLLRTHTSPMQLRAMEQRKPPVRLIVPGRTFRHEATDASHETTFYQVEGLVIDKCISVANLLSTLESFFKTLYGTNVKIRPQGSYFPFTEPSMEIFMSCLICEGEGCSVCSQRGWLEMLGAGMVHPQVLKNMGVDADVYSGFAFGGGIDRMMMLYHGINDIRLSYRGNLKFLEQF